MEQKFVSFNVEGMHHVDILVSSLISSSLSYMNEKANRKAELYNKMKPIRI